MRKLLFIALIFILTACSGISQEEHDAVVSEKNELSDEIVTMQGEAESLNTEVSNLKEENSTLRDEKDTLSSDYDSLNTEYSEYKERMEPYEELDSAEAEARQIEADRVVSEEEAARQAEEEQEAQEAAEKEAAGYETGITYDQLARTPDDYMLEKVKFYGSVVQLIEGDEVNQLRVAVDDDYDKIILIEYDPSEMESRVLEDDYITAYGYSMGIISYQSTLGGKISIPAMIADKIEIH